MPKTVFILGAGASIPYGFPSGVALVEKMILLLSKLKTSSYREIDPLRNLILENPENDIKFLIEFKRSLYLSRSYSIDAFLERRPKFRELGKILIRYILLECEQQSKTFYFDENGIRNALQDEFQKNDWYRYFFNEIKDQTSFDFKIYTYNYDRSLEYYLIQSYLHFFDFELSHAIERVSAMDITHLHGSLGRIKTEQDYHENGYGLLDEVVLYKHLKKKSDLLEIIYEASKKNIEKLHMDIKIARHVVFVGFGFDKNNMNNMKLKTIPFSSDSDRQTIYASRFRMTENEFYHRLYGNILILPRNTGPFPGASGAIDYDQDYVVTHADETALDFFRNTLPPSTYVE